MTNSRPHIFTFLARKKNKRQSIAKKVGYGLTILVVSLASLSALTLWSILHLRTTLNNLSESAIPAAEEGSKLVNLGQHLLYATEHLSGATSHPARRIAQKGLNKTIINLKNVIRGQTFNNKIISSNLSGLETTLNELGDLVGQRIDVNKKTEKVTSDLFLFEGMLIDYVAQTGAKLNGQAVAVLFAKWASQAMSIITFSSNTGSLNILYKINKAEKKLLIEFKKLEGLSVTLPENLQPEISLLEAKLGHILLSKNGLISLLAEKVKISSQTAARANFTGSLVKEFEGISTNLFNTITKATANDIKELSRKVDQLIWTFLFFSTLGIVAAFGVTYYFRKNLTSRLLTLNRAILNRMEGQDVVIEDQGNDEITDMAHSFKYFADEVEARENKLLNLAAKDPLTEISNRRYFLEQGEKELRRSQRTKTPTTFLMIDLDYFKNINDTYGHHVGDIVLRDFAKCTQKMLRDVDCFGRIGGEEFGVLLPNTSLEKGAHIAERIRKKIEMVTWLIDEISLSCTVSIGFSASEENKTPLNELMKQADHALYQAKRDGRNLCRNYKNMTRPA